VASRVIAGASLGRLALRLGLGSLAVFALSMLANAVTSFYPDNPLVFGKHPPDLSYIALYTGLTFLLVALHSGLERLNTMPIFRAVALLGQTALFFYVIHIRLIEVFSPLIAPLEQSPLLRSLLITLLLLPVLLLLCALYRRYKRQHPQSLLQYL
jgi:surface polysaccharide O-acyltransferase-like enzyme